MTSMMETPVAFPLVPETPHRVYAVNDAAGTVTEKEPTSAAAPQQQNYYYSPMSGGNSLFGSVSSLNGGSSILTTSTVPDQPWMIVVMLLSSAAGSSGSKIIMIHLDLSECQYFQDLIKAQAFEVDHNNLSGDNNVLQLVLVDSAGVVLTLRFTADTLLPVPVIDNDQNDNYVRCLRVTDQVLAANAACAGGVLRSSMVAFLSPDTLLVSWNAPLLVAIDLETATVVPWTKTQTMETMKARSSHGLRKMVTKSKELLLGKQLFEKNSVLLDMKPVSAICVADNDYDSYGSMKKKKSIFTLHADGVVRHWQWQPHQLTPWSVHEIACRSQIPDASTWSDEVNSTYLTARLYGHTFVLAFHIQTTVAAPDDDSIIQGLDASERPPASSNHVLVVVDGPILQENDDEMDAEAATHAIRLVVPVASDTLVGMQFDAANPEQCQLRALFRTTTKQQQDGESRSSRYNNSSSIFVTYPSSNLSTVRREPTVLASEYTLGGVALQERDRIAALSLPKTTTTTTTTSSDNDDVLEPVDRLFLQHLFRPAFPRGTGSVLPPSAAHIRRAMSKLGAAASSYHHPSSDDNDDTDGGAIEIAVINFIHAWRRRDHQKIISMTPLKKRAATPARATTTAQTPGSTMAYADSAAADSLSIYDAIGGEEIDDDDEVMVEMDYMDEEEENRILDKQKEIEAHEGRWRQFLLQIFEEEEVDRAPIAFVTTSSRNNTSDVSVIVRPGCISAVTEFDDAKNQNEILLSRLDEMALRVLDSVANDAKDELRQTESFAWETLSTGRMALLPDDATKLKTMLSHLPGLDEISDDELVRMVREVQGVSEDQWLLLLDRVPFESSLPGLCLLPNGTEGVQNATPQYPVLGIQGRLTAASLVVRSADSARRLFLGRFLVLSELAPNAANMALLSYLHATNVLGIGARTVPLPVIVTLDSSLQQLRLDQSGMSPPARKRTRVTSLLEVQGTRDKTVVLDSLLIQLSQNLEPMEYAADSLSGGAAFLGRAAMDSTFGLNRPGTLMKLPELGILSKSNTAANQPGLVLRLIAPLVSLLNSGDDSAAHREEILAECLLSSRFEAPDQSSKMIRRAFDLLRFDEANIRKSMGRLTALQDRIGGDRGVAGKMLIDFIDDAIRRMKDMNLTEDSNYDVLWSALFNASTTVRDWKRAHDACVSHPNSELKADNFKRLVRAMVDSGCLADLLSQCSMLAGEPLSAEYAHVYQNVEDFYGIAEATLSELCLRDIYTSLAVEQEAPSDYLGALFALHVSQGEWKKAAQAQDRRYIKARHSLATPVLELSLEQQVRREKLIVDDLVLAAISCRDAMAMVTDSAMQYLVSGQRNVSFSISGGPKRGREDNPRSGDSEINDGSGVYMTMDDIEARAVKCIALKTLFYDGSVDPTFAKSALVNESSSKITDPEIIDQLFSRGYYPDSLSLAMALQKAHGGVKTGGRGMFHDSLSHLLCSYLVPVVLDKNFAPQRPTLRQLEVALDCLKPPSNLPVVLAGSRSKKIANLQRSEIRSGAASLLRELTITYTNAEQPLAVEVAASILGGERAARPVPLWLENLILFGTDKTDLPGLFARRRKSGSAKSVYLGDPTSLLSLYTKRGLYRDACRVVCAVFAGPDGTHRETIAPSRLPEKGEIDFCPYDKIDLLWNLIELKLRDGDLGTDASNILKAARADMEQSVTKNFELLKLSDMGMKSARALSS